MTRPNLSNLAELDRQAVLTTIQLAEQMGISTKTAKGQGQPGPMPGTAGMHGRPVRDALQALDDLE